MSYFRKRRPAIYINTGDSSSSFVAAADGPASTALKEALLAAFRVFWFRYDPLGANGSTGEPAGDIPMEVSR